MEGEIDFDPFTAEGKEDINDTVDDEYESFLLQEDETTRGWYERMTTKFGPNTKFAISRIRDLFKTRNPRSSVPVYLQMKEDYQTDYRTPQYEMIAEITSDLKEKRPNVDLSQLDFKVSEKGRAMVKYTTGNKWYFLYNSKTGDFLKSLPKNIQDALGDPPLREQKEVIEQREEIEMKDLKEAREDAISEAIASDDPELRIEVKYIRDLVDLKKDSKSKLVELIERVREGKRMDETKEAVEKLMRDSIDQLKNMSKESKSKVREFFERAEWAQEKDQVLREASKKLVDSLKNISEESKSKVREFFERTQRAQEKDQVLREASNKLVDSLKNISEESKSKVREFFERAERAQEKDQVLREASKKLVDSLKNISDESKKKFLVFMKKIEAISGEEGKEVIIEDMTNFYDDMQEEIDRLKEELQASRNFNINRMTQPEWADDLRELQHKLENKEIEVEVLKESMDEAERHFAKENEEVIKAKKLASLASQKRIKTLIEDRNDARKDYFNIKERYDNIKEDLDTIRKAFREELQRHKVNLDRLKETEDALNKTREEKGELQRQVIVKEEQLRNAEQAIKELEEEIERQREVIGDQDKSEAEREAAQRELESLQERIAELQQQKDNLERELGLTRREKIKRLLQKAGLGTMFAGAVAGIVSLIMNILNPVGRGVKKLGNEAGKEFKKLGKQLDDTGKKMAASIPGLIGSVLSLILRTGGELLKFVGNNIWILVVAIGAVLLKWLTEKR